VTLSGTTVAGLQHGHTCDVTKLGTQEGDPLIVDLRGKTINSLSDFWDVVAEPCGLPDWFGRNLDAWTDTLYGGISEVLDSHPFLVLRVNAEGLFAPGNEKGVTLSHLTNESGQARIDASET
jgi:hypothetical protein